MNQVSYRLISNETMYDVTPNGFWMSWATHILQWGPSRCFVLCIHANWHVREKRRIYMGLLELTLMSQEKIFTLQHWTSRDDNLGLSELRHCRWTISGWRVAASARRWQSQPHCIRIRARLQQNTSVSPRILLHRSIRWWGYRTPSSSGLGFSFSYRVEDYPREAGGYVFIPLTDFPLLNIKLIIF